MVQAAENINTSTELKNETNKKPKEKMLNCNVVTICYMGNSI